MTKIVVVDSDAIFALYNPNDPLNTQATTTFQQLITQGFVLIYPTSVVFEVISLFQRVLPNPKVTQQIVDMIKEDLLITYTVDTNILKASIAIFNPRGSKKNTLIDCSVAAITRKMKAAGVFSYDSFYTKQGLKLAKDLV